MSVPERQLLTAVGGMKAVVDVKHIAMARRYVRGEMIDQSAGEPASVFLRRRILEAADGRLRGEITARLRAAPDRHLQRRVGAQRILVDAISVAASDAEHARCDDLEELVGDARRVASIRQGLSDPADDADLLLGRPQQQHARIRRLIAAVEIDCEFLARDGWQIKRKRRSVSHGRGVPLQRRHACFATVCLSDFSGLRHGQRDLAHA